MTIKLGTIKGDALMTKEEILEKSRKENKNQDIYEKEVIIKGNRYACIVAFALAMILFVSQIFIDGEMNLGLYAVVCSIPMAGCWTKYVKLHKKNELFPAVCYTISVIVCFTAHIYGLISNLAIG